MATRPTMSVAQGDAEGEARHHKLVEANDRLAEALERANAWGALVDPHVLLDLGAAIEEAMDAAGMRPGCRHRCAARSVLLPGTGEKSAMHCPLGEPPELVAATLRAVGWVEHVDEIEARVAAGIVCLCGTPCELVGLIGPHHAPGRPELVSWAVCPLCRHWVAL
jgi:hypothetical protein